MSTGGFWALEELSDEALQHNLAELIKEGTKTEAHVVAHLAEVEARHLHLLQGYESLFAYCKRGLGLSGNEAFYRIVAARMASHYPVIFGLIERRELFISTLPLLRDYISPENHVELLEAVRGKSKAEVLELLAKRAPRPDARSHVRRLPTTPRSVSAGPTGTLEPLSSVSYRLQLNIGHTLKQKLELARDLMSHANPDGDLAVVVERALDVLIAKLKARRFGQTSRPREARSGEEHFDRSKSTTPAEHSDQSKSSTGEHFDRSKSTPTPAGQPDRRRRHVPHEVRREVVARDGLQCSYTAPDGQRCQARALLQFDHQLAVARGGPDVTDNLRLFCARHNALHATQDFGTDAIHDAIRRRRRCA